MIHKNQINRIVHLDVFSFIGKIFRNFLVPSRTLRIIILNYFVEWSFHFIINWSCQWVLQSCKQLRLLKFCYGWFSAFSKHFNFVFSISPIFIHDGKRKIERKSFIGRGSVGTIVKSSLKNVQKKLFHTSLYFNSCKIINFSTGMEKKEYSNTLNGVSNKTFHPLMEILFFFCSITQ